MQIAFLTRLFLIVTSFALATDAQESRARVPDPLGATVLAASIAVKNLDTNVASSAVSNEQGFYTIPPLNPGK